MNFDELKDAWANESVEGPAVPTRLKSTTDTIISRLRKNMKREFLWTIFGLAATLAYMICQKEVSVLTFFAVFMLFVQSGYFFTRFFLFYKRSARYDMGLKENIRQFVYELELNLEVYQTYSICITPVSLLAWLGLLTGGHSTYFQFFNEDIGEHPRKLISMLLVIVSLQIFGASAMFRQQKRCYKQRVQELKSVASEFED